MSVLRASSLLFSMLLHGAVLAFYVGIMSGGGTSLEEGSGNDLLRIEQGIALEGLTRLGDAPETIEAREVEEQQASLAQPELEEIKAAEVPSEEPPPVEDVKTVEQPPDLQDVIASPLGPEAVEKVAPPREVRRPQIKQVATEQQVQQVAVLEQKAAGKAQDGGDATAYRVYLGSLRKHIERFKVQPKARERGTVLVRFAIDRDGKVLSREIATSSGSSQLDQAALTAIDKAAPFPKLPDDFKRQQLVLSIPFRFVTR